MSKEPKSKKKKLLYAFGSIGDTGSYSLVSTFLLYFLIDIVLLDAWLAAIIYMFSYGIWNAINDPIIGVLSDKTKTRWGRRKPYIMLGAPLSLLFYILMWGPPVGLNSFETFLFLLIVVSGYEFAYSMAAVGWFAVYPEIWESVEDRSEVVIYRQLFAVIGGAFASGVFPFLQVSLSNTFGEIPGWTWASAILGAIFTLSFLISLFGIKERKEFAIDKRLSIGTSIKRNLKSRALLTYMGIHMMTWSMMGWMGAMAPFLIVHSLGLGLEVVTLVMVPYMFATIGFFPLWRKLYMRFGPKKSLTLAISLHALFYLPVLFITGIIGVTIWGGLIGIALSGVLVTREVMVADVCDSDECQTGVRREGSLFGFTKMSSRSSLVLIGLLTAILLDVIIGYDPLLPDPPIMNMGIRVGVIGFVLLFTVILFVFLKLYPLNTEKVMEIRKKIEEMHAEKKKLLAKTNDVE